MNARLSNLTNDNMKLGFGQTQIRKFDQTFARFESNEHERPIEGIDALLAKILDAKRLRCSENSFGFFRQELIG